jgi:phytoene dehydrogenase-like protein
VGVTLSDGTIIKARRGVVSNANIWGLPKLLQNAADTGKLSPLQISELMEAPNTVAKTKSFSHLHLGIDAKGLDRSKLLAHYTVMDQGLHCADPCADRNMVAVSNPSMLDSSLVRGSTEGSHLMIHAYTAGNEDFAPWDFDSNKNERDPAVYALAKSESCEVLFRSVCRALDISREELASRTDVQLLGSPYTHKRFLLRDEGTYGAEFGSMLAGPTTTLPGLFLTGDSTFPGIGVPAVAVSGAQAANSMVSVARHVLFGRPQ